jgi:hypothetical protein
MRFFTLLPAFLDARFLREESGGMWGSAHQGENISSLAAV